MPARPAKPCPVCHKATQGQCCKPRPKQHHNLYSSRWKRLRREYLTINPLCEDCQAEGKVKLAEEIHHRIKHGGNTHLFWDVENWQGLCKHHHSIRTNKGE